jgi:Lon protease-like protein
MAETSTKPMFPLEAVLLPDDDLPLRIFEPRYVQLLTDCLASDREFGVVLIAAGREIGGGDQRYDVGTLARIVEHQEYQAGRYRLLCRIGQRIRVRDWLPDDPYPRAVVEPWPDEPGDTVTADQLGNLEDQIMTLFDRIATARAAELPSRYVLLGDAAPGTGAGDRLFTLASRLPMGHADRYSVLAAPSAADRLQALQDALDTVVAMVDFQLAGD